MVKVQDPFGAYNELVRLRRGNLILIMLMLLVTSAALFFSFLLALRPLPVVVRHDNPRRPVTLVDPRDLQDQAVREIDAKRFLFRSAERLLGWTSLDVDQRLYEASLTMDAEWRLRFKKELLAEVDVPSDVLATGRTTLMNSYRLARIRNDIALDWDLLRCTASESLWHCRGHVTVESHPLLMPAVPRDAAVRRIEVKASFREVPPTELTIDGLLITFWDAKDV